jgi:hypothetical protein
MPNISIEPHSITLGPGETCQFRVVTPAEIAPRVTWEIVPPEGTLGEALGTVDQEGVYSAPAQLTAEIQVIIKATANGDTATAVVTLSPGDTRAGAPAERAHLAVRPSASTLGPSESQRFEAVDQAGASVAVTWSVIPDDPATVGSIDESGGYRAPAEVSAERSITIKASDKAESSRTVEAKVTLTPGTVAPSAPTEGTVQRFIAVTATGAGASDKAFVVLAPGKVTIIQGEVTLRAGERQVFQAHVSGDPHGEVTWAAPSPSVGNLDDKGEYTAPPTVPEDQTVIITTIAKASGDQGRARIMLLADPWTGWAPKASGVGLLALFVLAACVYYVWPPPLDRSKLNAAAAAQAAAERVLDQRQTTLTEAKETAARLAKQQAETEKSPPDPNAPAAAQASEALRQEKRIADENVRTRTVEMNLAAQDLKDKREAVNLEEANIKRADADEQHLFLLVVLAGALVSFVHVTRSFVDFIGNRRLRPSWTWWYVLQPFTGSALAVVGYLVLRGGFFVGTSAGGIVNPFGFVAVASLVGLFSKQATNKLDELFSTMFRTDKERELKDKLDPRGSQARAEQQGPSS